jgi:hypothetical protein
LRFLIVNLGFKNEQIAKEQCQLIVNDECCSQKFQSSGSKTNLIIGTGVVILGVILVAVIAYFVYLHKRKAKSNKKALGLETAPSTKPPVEYYDSGRVVSSFDSVRNSQNTKEVDSQVTSSSLAEYSASDMGIDTFKSPITMDALPEGSYKVKVIHKYDAIMPDELSLTVGQVLYLAHTFNDGWAYGINIESKLQGVFPKVCVAKTMTIDTSKTSLVGATIESPVDDNIKKRFSSLQLVDASRNSIQVGDSAGTSIKLNDDAGNLVHMEENERSSKQFNENDVSRPEDRTRVPFNQYLAQLDDVEAEEVNNSAAKEE